MSDVLVKILSLSMGKVPYKCDCLLIDSAILVWTYKKWFKDISYVSDMHGMYDSKEKSLYKVHFS